MNATEANIRKLQSLDTFGYYAMAKRANGKIGIIWSEVRPNRAHYWTGEEFDTQKEAEALVSERMQECPPVPPVGELEPVKPINPMI